MKFQNLLLTLAVLAISFSVSSQNKKEYLDGSLFFNQDAFLFEFEKQADIVYQSKNFLSIEDAEKQLNEVERKKIKISKAKQHESTLTPQEVYKKLLLSTVAFGVSYDCGQCDVKHVGASSGYVIDESGLIATNHHVVDSYIKGRERNYSMLVKFANGKVYPVTEVVTAAKDFDLAVVRVDTGGDKLIPIPFGDDAQVGDDVFILSNPFNMLFYFTTGMVARNILMDSYRKGDNAVPEMEVTADYAVGSSGAPIVDNKGNLIGTVAVTRSIYAMPQEKKDLQMVVKGTIPVVLLKELVEF